MSMAPNTMDVAPKVVPQLFRASVDAGGGARM